MNHGSLTPVKYSQSTGVMSILFSYPKSCTRPVKLSIQRLHEENDHLEVDLLRMIERNVGNCGNWDIRRHRFKMMLHSIQFLAGPLKSVRRTGFQLVKAMLPDTCQRFNFETLAWSNVSTIYSFIMNPCSVYSELLNRAQKWDNCKNPTNIVITIFSYAFSQTSRFYRNLTIRGQSSEEEKEAYKNFHEERYWAKWVYSLRIHCVWWYFQEIVFYHDVATS